MTFLFGCDYSNTSSLILNMRWKVRLCVVIEVLIFIYFRTEFGPRYHLWRLKPTHIIGWVGPLKDL